MFLFPYSSDAPLYHYPYGTIGLIIANTLIFFLTATMGEEQVAPYILQFGDGLHPVQWITWNFLHANFLHLAGNMFFLWLFGLIVEGKIGLIPFLFLYTTIGAVEGAAVQILMLNSDSGGALGASGAIFGLMAVTMIWAPKNEFQCVFIVWFFFLRIMEIEVSILVFCLIYAALEGLSLVMDGFAMSSALLHLIGCGVGGVFATVWVKSEWVDCENWDIFSVLAGTQNGPQNANFAAKSKSGYAPLTAARDVKYLDLTTTSPARTQKRINQALRAIEDALNAEDFDQALEQYNQVRTLSGWEMSNALYLQFFQLASRRKQEADAVDLFEDYLRNAPKTAATARIQLKLAQILIKLERPRKAAKYLYTIPNGLLPANLETLRNQLCERAKTLENEGAMELDDGD